jgi:hypothetical protein
MFDVNLTGDSDGDDGRPKLRKAGNAFWLGCLRMQSSRRIKGEITYP